MENNLLAGSAAEPWLGINANESAGFADTVLEVPTYETKATDGGQSSVLICNGQYVNGDM